MPRSKVDARGQTILGISWQTMCMVRVRKPDDGVLSDATPVNRQFTNRDVLIYSVPGEEDRGERGTTKWRRTRTPHGMGPWSQKFGLSPATKTCRTSLKKKMSHLRGGIEVRLTNTSPKHDSTAISRAKPQPTKGPLSYL